MLQCVTVLCSPLFCLCVRAVCPSHARCSVTRLPHVRGSPALRVLCKPPTPVRASAFVRLKSFLQRTRWYGTPSRPAQVSQVPRRFPFRSCRALRPRRSLQQPSPLAAAYHGLPDFRACRPPVLCHEAQSLHLRYGLSVALPTLSSHRHLRKPKTRFPVGRLFPLPGRESHPLESPGFSWRTEKSADVCV